MGRRGPGVRVDGAAVRGEAGHTVLDGQAALSVVDVLGQSPTMSRYSCDMSQTRGLRSLSALRRKTLCSVASVAR